MLLARTHDTLVPAKFAEPRRRTGICARLTLILAWVAQQLLTLATMMTLVKLNQVGALHFMRGDYELCVISALSDNLFGFGKALDYISFVLPLPPWMRFLYYPIALTRAPSEWGVAYDPYFLVLLMALGRLRLGGLVPVLAAVMLDAFLPFTVSPGSLLLWFTLPAPYVIPVLGFIGWAPFTALRLLPGVDPGFVRALVVMLASLIIHAINVPHRSLP